MAHRRVVTGLDKDGKSCVLFDDHGGAVGHGGKSVLLWKSGAAPASNEGITDAADEPSSFVFETGGTKFVTIRIPPGTKPVMHASDTLDYGIVLEGEITIVLETGEAVLHKGDFIIDRGVSHGWRNTGNEDAVILWTIVDAKPVGKGADLSRIDWVNPANKK